MKGMVKAVAILKVRKHLRTIDALIKWIERCLFHDEYNAPTEQDLHIWLKHAKKFKREQNNLKQRINKLCNVLESYPPEYMVEEENIFIVYCQACEGSWHNGADSKHDEDCEWEQALEGGDDEVKENLPPKERREDVEHSHPSP